MKLSELTAAIKANNDKLDAQGAILETIKTDVKALQDSIPGGGNPDPDLSPDNEAALAALAMKVDATVAGIKAVQDQLHPAPANP